MVIPATKLARPCRPSANTARSTRSTHPGDSDLTAHVNFQLVTETAHSAKTKVWGPVDQGVFLQRLGIAERMNTLLKRANVVQAHDIRTAVHTLDRAR